MSTPFVGANAQGSFSRAGGLWPLARLAFLLLLAGSSPLQAQGEARSIAGRVLLPGATRAGLPVAGAWVTLHRVGPDAAGPIDSMRTSRDGRYDFRYKATGDTSAIYFVSTSRGGVAYFTPPVRERAVRDGIAEIQVHDTTSAPLAIRTVGRHLIITAPDSATRTTRTVLPLPQQEGRPGGRPSQPIYTRYSELDTLVPAYWQASQVPPLRMASMEHAFFSSAVYSFFSALGAFSTVAFSMLEAPRVRR